MPKHPERKAERRAMPEAAATPPLPPFQDPHGLVGSKDGSLETAIGREVREFRKRQEMTVAELAKLADLSAGMLTKIKNASTSRSVATLQGLSRALQLPATARFRKHEGRRHA